MKNNHYVGNASASLRRFAWPDVAWVVAGFALVVVLFVMHFGYYVPLSNDDDPYITYRYAHNLLHGHGLVWNVGEPMQGYSNLLWVLLNALLAPVVGDFLTASRLLSVAAYGGVVAIGVAELRRVAAWRAGWAWGVLYALLVVSCAPLMRYAVYGWELAMFPALLMGGLFAYRREVSGESPQWWSLPLVAAMILSRSEAPAHLAAFAAVRFVMWRQGREFGRRDWAWWGSAAAIVGGYLVFQFAYFGTVLTGPYVAKIAGHTQFAFGREYMLGILLYGGLAATLMYLVGGALCIWQAPVRAAMWLVPCAVQAAVILRANGDFWPGFRLFAGMYPLLYLAALTGFAMLARRLARRQWRRGLACAAALLALATAWDELNTDRVSVARFLRHGSLGEKWRTAQEQRVAKKGLWSHPVRRLFAPPAGPFQEATALVLNHTRPGEAVVFPDIGFIGLSTGRTLYDQRGLVDWDAARSIYAERQGDASAAADAANRFVGKLAEKNVTFVGVAAHATMINDILRDSDWLRDQFTRVGGTPDHAFFLRKDRLAAPLDAETTVTNWRAAARVLPRYRFFSRR